MYNAKQHEEEILEFWKQNQIFEKSVNERSEMKPYVFYDGPPFATGLPHYGHIVASLMKDVVPRYFTMKGFRVERKWGWDCHGLPIENIIEKELKLESKKDIEAFGIGKFNEACRATVLKYAEEWKQTINRMGRWVDMQNDYKTMDLSYMESVWWVFAELWKNGLVYEGHKAMHICPRCVTPLSNFEVTQGYKDVKDISAFVKCKMQGTKNKLNIDEDIYLLAWTTTPWTLPGNVLLAVNNEIEYAVFKVEGKDGLYVAAHKLVPVIMADTKYDVVKKVKGSDLAGLTYEPLFPYFKDTENAFRVVAAEFVSTDEGTGIVHIAPAFGEDDYNVGKSEEIPLVQHVGMDGKFVDKVTDFAGLDVKPKEDPTATDVEIIKWLAHNDKLFAKKKFEHSYPHCWRCDTPLLNYATSCWFVKVTHIREMLLETNKDTSWVPEHIKDGRFGKWLEGARDWAVSRNRFWGTPLPVWRCEGNKEIRKLGNFCETVVVIGSVEELEKLSGKTVKDLHKHFVDEIEFACEKCGGTMRRVPEVLDCWFESGSMPYGQMHYPFENKKKFEAGFPAEFIAEGQDQTRGWFYTLHVLATALTMGKKPSIPAKKPVPAFHNVIVNGIVLAEDGKKMSKRLKNYPDPGVILEKYGADAMRYYLVTSPVMHAESLNFSETGVRESFNKVVNTVWNVLEFYRMYADQGTKSKEQKARQSNNVLDKWILAKLQLLIQEVTEHMEKYELAEASRPIEEFINELSTWYVRRSRDRFKFESEDTVQALATLRHVLLELSKVMAPFTPFVAERIYGEIRKLEIGNYAESVHLEEWPRAEEKLIDKNVLEQMEKARKVVEMGLSLRAEAGVKVRQVLSEFSIFNFQFSDELGQIVAEELNVKKVISGKAKGEHWKIKDEGGLMVALNVEITPELQKEGLVREIVRAINTMRKEQKLTREDMVSVAYETQDALLKEVFTDYADEIVRQVLAKDVREGGGGKVVEIDGKSVQLAVRV